MNQPGFNGMRLAPIFFRKSRGLFEIHGATLPTRPPSKLPPTEIPSLKLTVRHGKCTILMVFTRKDGIFMGCVSFREGKGIFSQLRWHLT